MALSGQCKQSLGKMRQSTLITSDYNFGEAHITTRKSELVTPHRPDTKFRTMQYKTKEKLLCWS